MDWDFYVKAVTMSLGQVFSILDGIWVLFTLVLVATGVVVAMVTRRRRAVF